MHCFLNVCIKHYLLKSSILINDRDYAAHNALHKVVLQDTLLRDMKKLCGFHHTSSLEVFHSLLLKYCTKLQHFSYMRMQAHIELAILDHNYNTQQKQATTKDGIYIRTCVLLSFHIYFQVKLDIQ